VGVAQVQQFQLRALGREKQNIVRLDEIRFRGSRLVDSEFLQSRAIVGDGSDDGSVDAVAGIQDDFVQKFRLRLFEQQHVGLRGNFFDFREHDGR